MNRSEPIVRRKLSDEVFLRLKRLITSGELQPGDDMPSERELMERFAVGRPAIREAMQALSNMGLVAISHGERAKVLQLTAKSIIRQVDGAAKIILSSSKDTLEHLKNARIFFERGMVREAAEKATAEDVQRLRATVAEQRSFRGDSEAFISADMKFHTQIAAISGNPIYVAVSEAMLGWLKEYHTEMLIWTGKENFTLTEHEEIIGRIEHKDADGAEKAMIKHLERSRALYVMNSG
ncbi:MAG: transcriptional regulator NanR [Mesorhizobium sp.]|uniref:transcriptional regulator NanR n=1 Tax=Mesorhizobium sp. TaxID=1871066 RepID=UPI000FE3E371|nr:transcriptional regulator NanR [Mesorhizobium sp.]RWN62497.1 MAG: transcriptional regulator NanR [Mesorhizobium sp.]RWO32870.1 MAG: transcriptional regulator NanR [Mesorhizobium sp.]RWO47356.1 MAG: transcriptional regulator NanR [Mesorhizobium sp.]TIN80893.1 MAG: transcriptional regulator NanR [Mesorhizobium sp.]TJV59754.1 MAG: transcriptional regulator NanR [Mesorhizobium sp.]